MVGKRCAAAAAVKQKGPSPWDLLGLESSDTPSYGRKASLKLNRAIQVPLRLPTRERLAWPNCQECGEKICGTVRRSTVVFNQGSAFSEAAAMTHR
jgi:hypothetical protein